MAAEQTAVEDAAEFAPYEQRQCIPSNCLDVQFELRDSTAFGRDVRCPSGRPTIAHLSESVRLRAGGVMGKLGRWFESRLR